MATKKPKVGDPVIHHGRPHEITNLKGPFAVWENERYRVTGNVEDLRWSEADEAWYEPGRVLARNERAVLEAVTGSWPPAEEHLTTRAMLDAVDLDQVSRPRLRRVLLRRKADVTEDTVDQYVDACLAQVAELRALRQES